MKDCSYIFVQGSQQNSTNGPGASLMPSGAHYPVRHRHVIAKQHSCPELALIPFTKPCPASRSSDHEQYLGVDFLIYPSNLGSDLCKIWCCTGAAAEWGLPYGVLWPYVSRVKLFSTEDRCRQADDPTDRPNCYLLFCENHKAQRQILHIFVATAQCCIKTDRSQGITGRSTLKSEMKLINWEGHSRKWSLSEVSRSA
jgi:hypothetical protein